MQGCAPFSGPVSMRVLFILGNRRRIDLDNLNKAICDAMNGIVFEDDTQVVSLHLLKRINQSSPGVHIQIYPGSDLPPMEETKQGF
jgi:Holliday junction resolvase RusA-like endonuclease